MLAKRFTYDYAEEEDPFSQSGFPWSINRTVLHWVPPESQVLELGCATGYMGKALSVQNKCEMWGIEIDPVAYDIAKAHYKECWNWSLNDGVLPNTIPDRSYDVILCLAVLEHLKAPDVLLKNLRRKLKEKGVIIISLPNIAHWSIRWGLLRGSFNYSDYGILDRTHLRFFTLQTARQLVTGSGFRICREHIDFDCGFRVLTAIVRRLPMGWPILKALYGMFPNVFAYQVLFRIEPI